MICLVGWVFYAFLAHQHYAAAMTKLKNPQLEIATVNLPEPPSKPVLAKSSAPAVTNVAFELLQARTREIMELRGKIAQLETATTQLSRSIAQQKALLGESNRIKFYHLAPVSTASAGASTAPLSPGLQRAVFMALARELGWLPTDHHPPRKRVVMLCQHLLTLAELFHRFASGQPECCAPATATTTTASGQPTADNTTPAAAQVHRQPNRRRNHRRLPGNHRFRPNHPGICLRRQPGHGHGFNRCARRQFGVIDCV